MDYPAPTPLPQVAGAAARQTVRVHAVAMVRNDADIILPFLRQCAELFDTTAIIDIQSTDGTRECIADFGAGRGRIVLLSTDRQEKFQGPMMNTLSRRAFAEGADWVFLLDADEFVDIPSRAALESALAEFSADVMHLSWVNLVPTEYGSFSAFDPAQEFRWSGRASSYFKVALSNLFAANHPDYHIHEGNHHVSARRGEPALAPCYGLPLLHVPIRSLQRFKYKISGALRITKAKHNRFAGEGNHVEALDRLLVSNISIGELNHFAGHYGEQIERKQELEPADLEWPKKRLPPFVRAASGEPPASGADLSTTLLGDRALVWDQAAFAPHSPVAALLDEDTIRIVPQPLRGDGRVRPACFGRLGDRPDDPRSEIAMLTDAAAIAGMPIQRDVVSAWSELIPVLFALLSISRPRRFVALGVHTGMSFCAACQAVEHLGLDAECVAIDSWDSDGEIFSDFVEYLATKHPGQVYIQSYFDTALRCFEDGSIDLLQFDGLQTYDAVRGGFDAWLPKLSAIGVITFRNSNTIERDCGVWRLWDELSRRYPSFSFRHGQGLGIIYVGSAPSPVATVLKHLAAEPERAILAQTVFAAAGTLAVAHRARLADCERLRADAEVWHGADTSAAQAAAAHRRELEQLRSLLADAQSAARVEAERLHAITRSTAWRATGPLRRLLDRSQVARGMARLVWRSVPLRSRNR